MLNKLTLSSSRPRRKVGNTWHLLWCWDDKSSAWAFHYGMKTIGKFEMTLVTHFSRGVTVQSSNVVILKFWRGPRVNPTMLQCRKWNSCGRGLRAALSFGVVYDIERGGSNVLRLSGGRDEIPRRCHHVWMKASAYFFTVQQRSNFWRGLQRILATM